MEALSICIELLILEAKNKRLLEILFNLVAVRDKVIRAHDENAKVGINMIKSLKVNTGVDPMVSMTYRTIT